MSHLADLYPNIWPQAELPEVEYHRSIGFYTLRSAVGISSAAGGAKLLVGFGAPIAADGSYDTRQTVTPITDISDLAPDARRIDELNKGVGPHMYNTPQAVGGNKYRPDAIGVYTFRVRAEARWLDARALQGSPIQAIGKQLGNIIASNVTDVETVVRAAEARYGDADIVQFGLPPRPRTRQILRRIKNPEGINPGFLLIRDSRILLNKIGEIATPNWGVLRS